MNKFPLVLISTQVLIRHALAELLGSDSQYEVVGEVNTLQEICLSKKDKSVCLVLLDAESPDSQIKEVLTFADQQNNKVIMFGSKYNKRRLVELMALKADGYITTDISLKEFLELLDKVKHGGLGIADSLIGDMMDELSKEEVTAMPGDPDVESDLKKLTPREREILKLLAKGYTNCQIADKLFISIYTVKNHVHHILDKLNINNRTSLVSFALTRGIVSDGIVLKN